MLFTLPIALISWGEEFLKSPWQTYYYAVGALLAFSCSYFLFKRWKLFPDEAQDKQNRMLPAMITWQVMILLLASTLLSDIGFNERIISLFIESAIAVAVARMLFQSSLLAAGLALYYVLPLCFLLWEAPEIGQVPFLNFDLLTISIATASLASSTWVLGTAVIDRNAGFQRFILNCLRVFTALCLMNLIWGLCLQFTASEPLARGASLIIYTLFAEFFIYIGNTKGLKDVRVGGFAVLIFVIARLLLTEAWVMPVIIRTLTFIVTGILLIATAFFDKNTQKRTISLT